MSISRAHLDTATTLVVAALGGALFAWARLPVPWLAGSMFAVACMAMSGFAVRMPRLLRDAGFLVAGISLGATVTPEALRAIARYPLSITGLVLSIVATVYVSSRLLERIFGWDRTTAYLASVPGALSMVMAMAAASNGDIRRIAIAQAVRLFALVIVMPLAINATTVTLPPNPAPLLITPGGLLLLTVLTIVSGLVMRRLGMANPLFLGGMVISIVAHISGLVPGELPFHLAMIGMVLVGMFAGVRFEGTTFRMVLRELVPSFAALIVALGVAVLFGMTVHVMTGLPLAAVLVAFAPGGVEAMIMMGAAMGLDTLYISTHHILRWMGLNVVTPFVTPLRPTDD